MSWVIVAVAVSTAFSARAQSNAAKQQEIEYEIQADQEKLAAESQELDRTQKLNKVLAANAVGIADSGMSGEGTPASIALKNAEQASSSEGMASLTTNLKQAQLKRQARNASRTGNIQAASTLLKGASQVASLG